MQILFFLTWNLWRFRNNFQLTYVNPSGMPSFNMTLQILQPEGASPPTFLKDKPPLFGQLDVEYTSFANNRPCYCLTLCSRQFCTICP